MAIENAKMLNVRIKNKYDSYESWVASNLVLEAGEIAIAYTSVDVKVDNGVAKHPALLMKVGNGTDTFKDLPWMSARAADVLAVCKDEAELKTFVNNVIADAGIASSDAMEALSGRVTTAEGKVTTLEGKMTTAEGKITANEGAIATLNGLVGNTSVNAQIKAYVDALNLADTYAAKTHGHAIADVEGLSDSIAAAKKAGTDANAALEAYKTTNDAAVKVNSDAITAIKNGTSIDNFKEVEEALAGKQAAGDYSVVGHKHEIADVNGLSDAIADAKKAGTDAAAAAGQALVDAKKHTDDEMARLVGATPVADQIDAKITALDLANTYDTKGAAAAAETAAKGHADGLNTAMDGRMQAVEAKKHEHTNKTVLDGITAEKVATWDAAEANAIAHADDLDEAMDARVLALEAKFGDGEGNVEAQIAAAVAAEAKLRDDADKVLQGLIESNDADILALQGLVGTTNVATAIETAVNAEKERAMGIEGGLETRLAAVEADYLTSADEKALQDQIDANASAIELLTNGVSADEVDGVNDLIQYVKDHGTEVTGIKADIKANADDIDGLETRIGAAETAIDTKAAQSDLEGAVTRIGTAEGKITTLEGEMDAAEGRLDALETKVGDKTVAAQIEAAVEDAKTDASNKDAVVLAEAQKSIAAAQTALEAEIAKKANNADLAAIAKTGSTDDLVQGAMVLVFDCGNASM